MKWQIRIRRYINTKFKKPVLVVYGNRAAGKPIEDFEEYRKHLEKPAERIQE